MTTKKRLRRILKASLKGAGEPPKSGETSRISTSKNNFEQALFQDVDGPADDAWRKAMHEMFPYLNVQRTTPPDEQPKED